MVQVTLVTPPTQVQTVSAGGQQAQSATQNGAMPSSYLSPGALVAGIITGKDAGGSYMLKTEKGTFTLHSNTPLTYNSDVLIRVDNSSDGNANARIVSVNGEAFSTFSAPAQQESDSLSPSLLAKAGAQQIETADMPDAPPATKPAAIPAVVVPAPAGTGAQTGATPAPQAQIPAGTQVILNTIAADDAPLPAPPTTTTPTTATPAAPANANPTVPQTANVAASPAQSTTQPAPTTGSAPTQQVTPQSIAPQTAASQAPAAPTTLPELPANVAKLIVAQPQALNDPKAPSSFFTAAPAATTPPPAVQTSLYAAYTKAAAPAPATASTSAAALLNATVVATNDDGTVTLQTAQGILTVKPENMPALAQLPPGTPLSVSLPAIFSALSDAEALPEDSLLSTLKQAIATLQGKSPAAAAELLNRLPAMGADFLSTSLSFLSALLSGNSKKILGENATVALQNAGADEITSRFTSHAAATAQNFQQQPAENTANWQSLVLPFVYQGAVQEARIYVKRDGSRKNTDGKKTTEDTRFIVEITFDDLGELQMDGIVLPKENNTVFDLIIRSQTAFLPEEKNDIMQIYASAAELTGFQGNLSFSVSKDFPVKPLAEMHKNTARDIIA